MADAESKVTDVARPMRIVRLSVEAFKRLSAVDITPDPDASLVRITGRNGAGKSSVLDAIEAALAGGRSIPERPIRAGYHKATVLVDLDGLVVERTFTKSGGALIVKSKDGTRIGSPQAVLDRLYGSLSFDPVAFVRMRPREQAEALKAAAGLTETLRALEAEREAAGKARTEARTRTADAERRLAKLGPTMPDGPDAETSIDEIAAKYREANDVLRAQARDRNELEDAKREVSDLVARRDRVSREIADLEARLSALMALRDSLAVDIKARATIVDAKSQIIAAHVEPDLEAIKAEGNSIEASNAAARARAEWRKIVAEVEATREAEARAVRLYDAKSADISTAISAARYPIAGLAVTDDVISLDGLPFAQASDAAKLRAAVAIGLASRPTIRVVLVREGSLLDDAGMSELAKVAADFGAQVWVEEVTNGDAVGIKIEDGQVAAQ